MQLMLEFLDPTTHTTPIATWKSETLVDALRKHEGLDLVARLPEEAHSTEWRTDAQSLSGVLSVILERLASSSSSPQAAGGESLPSLTRKQQREVDMTEEDKANLARAVSITHTTLDGFGIVDYLYPATEGGENLPIPVPEMVPDILALQQFLSTGLESTIPGLVLHNLLHDAMPPQLPVVDTQPGEPATSGLQEEIPAAAEGSTLPA